MHYVSWSRLEQNGVVECYHCKIIEVFILCQANFNNFSYNIANMRNSLHPYVLTRDQFIYFDGRENRHNLIIRQGLQSIE